MKYQDTCDHDTYEVLDAEPLDDHTGTVFTLQCYDCGEVWSVTEFHAEGKRV